MTIHRGDKVAFVGKNGEGKSTLVKCIMNEIDFQGKLELGHNVKIGYFAQNQAQLLDENLTVFETVDQVATGDVRTKIRDILGAFMFGGEASEKKVKTLSGGERSRLAMIRLLLEPVNLLILDEPTNHLDMASKDVLKKAISEFDGTAIIVSHDRYFLNELVTKIYEFDRGKVIEHLGGIYDFMAKKKLENQQQPETSIQNSYVRIEEKTNNQKRKNKLSYHKQKERNRQIRKLEKEIQETEEKITKMEEDLSSIESELTTPEGASNVSLLQSYIDLKNKITISMNIWEKLTLEMEKLQNNQ
jgi:ATP-binding cassette subfamily F protein 3